LQREALWWLSRKGLSSTSASTAMIWRASSSDNSTPAHGPGPSGPRRLSPFGAHHQGVRVWPLRILGRAGRLVAASQLRVSPDSAPAIVSRTPVRASEVRSGAALFLLRDLHRPLQQDRGPVHGADLHPPVWRSAWPGRTPCSAFTTPASPGSSGAVPSRLVAAGSSAPGTWNLVSCSVR
jgi:hypothetical protein